MTDVMRTPAVVVFMILFFPVVNGLAVLSWYNVIDICRDKARDTFMILVLAAIFAYVVTLVCVMFDVAFISSIVNVVSMLT